MGEVVYRIQDGAGRGPYRPGTSHLWTDDDHWRNPPFYTELGWQSAEISTKFKHGENGGCGFRSIEQLNRWFSPAEQRKLAERGYVIVQMTADRIVAETRTQVVFARKRPLWTGAVILPWDHMVPIANEN